MNSNPFRQAGTCTFLAMVLLASSAGCHSVDRSRALDDGRVSAITIAAQVCSNCFTESDVAVILEHEVATSDGAQRENGAYQIWLGMGFQ